MRLDDKTIADKLESMPAPEPPPELLERLKKEIPDAVELRGAGESLETGGRTSSARPWIRLAASLVLVIGGGLFAYWMVGHAPPLEETVETEERRDAQRALEPVGRPAEDASSAEEAEPPQAPTADRAERLETKDADSRPSSPKADGLGTLTGTIVDPEGYPLPGASVTVGDGDVDRRTISNAEGRFRVEVPAGEYDVATALEGFVTVEHGGVKVEAESDTSLRVESPPVLEEVVTVTSESPPVYERNRAIAELEMEMEKVPTARDSSHVIRETPGALADRTDAGGRSERKQARSRRAPMPDPAPQPAPPAPPATMPPSTGGTTEPNDQPYGDVFFRSYGVNPFVDTEDDALSTFGFDVDTGSYGVVRRYLRDGNLPPASAVRVEEIVNAFDYGDRPPRRGTFALTAEGAPSPWPPGERYYLLRLAAKGREVARAEERPVDLVFVIDTSGSMNYENRLGLVKRASSLLLDRLGPDDRVALVTYGSRGEVRLPFTRDEEAIRRAVERLYPDGSTNAEEGLALAYDLAARQGRRNAVRRILLCSDGVANVGATGPESILERIGEAARSGIELTTVGFGMGNYNDVLMEQLADRGNGRYAYVDTLAEAQRLFVEELTGTLYSIAAEARAQVEFDPAIVSRYRLLGYENRDIADERFRDDTVDAAEIGSGHTVTALYEIKLREGVEPRREKRPLGILRVRYRPIESERFEEEELLLEPGMLAPSWGAASEAFRLAAVAARFAEILRGSYWARNGDLHELVRRSEAVAEDWRGDERVEELVGLIRQAAELGGEGRKREDE